jgi:trans-aconitate methyltransferase
METRDAAGKRWDAEAYDQAFAFVTAHGVGLVERLAPRPGERILDLGCGTGELTARIAEAGAAAIGLDADEAMVARARARFPGLRFVHADAEAFALPDGPLDAVFSNAALHWMRRPAAVLAAVAAALRPGGRFVAEMGGAGNVAALEGALHAARAEAGLRSVPSPWFFPSIAAYARLLEEAGLEPRAMALFDRPTRLEGRGAEAVAGWYRMFATPLVADLSVEDARAVIDAAAARALPALVHREADGEGVFADYRRLRFEAVRRPPGA